jgi:hypothetical protein
LLWGGHPKLQAAFRRHGEVLACAAPRQQQDEDRKAV